MFKSLFSKVFKAIGSLSVSTGSSACLKLIFDEPEMAKSMIEK